MTARSTPLARMVARAFSIRGSSRALIAMTRPVRGSARRGDRLGALPGVGVVPLRPREGGDDALELGPPHRRLDPVQHPTEGHEADPVVTREIGGRQPGRRADLAGERGGGEGVDEQDQVGAPLGVAEVDVGLAAARRDPPVEPPRRARDVRPHLGELDAVAGSPRQAVAGGGAHLARPHQRSQGFGPGQQLELEGATAVARSGEHPEQPGHLHPGGADHDPPVAQRP